MSLRQAYSMAHTAQCRLQMAASEPDRNLRFVVGHLMHYESLRLRIVEIEHDISKNDRARAVAFRGTGHVGTHGPSPLSGGRKSPPPPAASYSDESDESLSGEEDDDAGGDLGLERFPSAAAQPPRPPPDLIPDDIDDDEDDYEPVSPEEPDQATLEALLQKPGETEMANLYNGIRKCQCHEDQDAPVLEKFWELPSDKQGVTRAVAQVWV